MSHTSKNSLPFSECLHTLNQKRWLILDENVLESVSRPEGTLLILNNWSFIKHLCGLGPAGYHTLTRQIEVIAAQQIDEIGQRYALSTFNISDKTITVERLEKVIQAVEMIKKIDEEQKAVLESLHSNIYMQRNIWKKCLLTIVKICDFKAKIFWIYKKIKKYLKPDQNFERCIHPSYRKGLYNKVFQMYGSFCLMAQPEKKLSIWMRFAEEGAHQWEIQENTTKIALLLFKRLPLQKDTFGLLEYQVQEKAMPFVARFIKNMIRKLNLAEEINLHTLPKVTINALQKKIPKNSDESDQEFTSYGDDEKIHAVLRKFITDDSKLPVSQIKEGISKKSKKLQTISENLKKGRELGLFEYLFDIDAIMQSTEELAT